MATIRAYETASGQQRYEITVYAGLNDLTGKKKYIHRRGFSSKKEATLAASRLTLEAEKNDLTNLQEVSYKVVYKQWFSGYVNTVRESTWAPIKRIFDNHILPLFGKKKIRDITTAQLQKIVNHWADEVKFYKRWYLYTVKVLAYAERQGYIASNPAKLVVVPKPKASAGDEPENFWSKEELAQFFSYLDQDTEPQKYALFRILAFGGLRRGECLALTWADVSFTDSTIRVNKTLTQGEHGKLIVQAPKTRMSRRTVIMDSKTMASLKYWRLQQIKVMLARGINANKPDQLVFATRTNKPKVLNQPGKWLRSIESAHNIEHRITIHGFRHSHASALFAAGASIKEVQVRLGHEDAQTTLNIYAHVTKGQNEETAKKVANYLNF